MPWSIIPTRLRPSRSRVQILSDLHLEIGQQYASCTFPASAPFLLLGGDIGRLIDYQGYLNFLEAQVSRYKRVFLVLGNHEFYGLGYSSGLDAARRLCQEPSVAESVVLLHRARWDDADSRLTILGRTLWSAIPECAYSAVESKVSDMKKIEGWSIPMHNQMHGEDLSWLREKLSQLSQMENSKRRLLVATHHAPCIDGTSRPEHTNNPWTPAFATRLLEQGGWDGVKVWNFGHTRYSADFMRDGIRVVSNQRGYVLPGSIKPESEGKKSKKDAHGFDSGMAITL
ncbi:calcineurin-like phosphoesterase [Drechmeria coniospora]|uniref:Calcineurin-like phosphoesterase n=1 Tax=Drechmeria coniospora TaxID=98403 RepID=A0A151GBH9_DRECN|nr:calcineurin-like phosphoesterase [Drechmeria coniospora]KYK54458.1 calcineurin-like phosphoesterase [Drechmeria coniospora]ODA77262.1 hypothetical protein RJ55_06889 [Drechmeria coniospora]